MAKGFESTFIEQYDGIYKLNEFELAKYLGWETDGNVVDASEIFAMRGATGEAPDTEAPDAELVEIPGGFRSRREYIEHVKKIREKLSDAFFHLFFSLNEYERRGMVQDALTLQFGELSDVRMNKGYAYAKWMNEGGDITEVADRYGVPSREIRQIKTYMPRYLHNIMTIPVAKPATAVAPKKREVVFDLSKHVAFGAEFDTEPRYDEPATVTELSSHRRANQAGSGV